MQNQLKNLIIRFNASGNNNNAISRPVVTARTEKKAVSQNASLRQAVVYNSQNNVLKGKRN